MFCPNCGVENPDSAAECRRCHVPFHDEAHAEAAAAPEANAAGAICARCETFNEPGVERCTTCGYPLLGGEGHAAPPLDATPAEAHPAHDPLAALAAHAHHDDAGGAHPHDDAGSTHALSPVSASDTPAEGNPSIADELSALELSPEDARAARGEDATPPDGSAPVPPQTAEHKLDLSASNPFDEDHAESTNVSATPFDGAAAPAQRPSDEPALEHTPPAPMRIARTAPPPPSPVSAPAPVAAAPAPAAPAEKICASCASANLPNAKFCAECGTPFPKKPAAPLPAASEPPKAPEPKPAPAVVAPPAAALAREREESAPVPDHTPAEPHPVHAAEELHAPAHEEAPPQGDFDPTRTDQAKAEPAVESEHTSEQPRLQLSDEHRAGAEADAHESAHPGSPAEFAIESVESVESAPGDPGGEAAPADATPAEPYATGAEADAHPLTDEQPAEEAGDVAAQEDSLPEELAESVPGSDEPPPPPPEDELPPAEQPDPAAHEEPAFAEAEGQDPLADVHEQQPHDEQPHDEQAQAEQPQEEAQLAEALAEEPLAEEAPAEELAAGEPPAEEPPAEEALAADAEQTFEHAAAEPDAAPAPEPVLAPYAVQLIVEQGLQAGTSFQLPYTENSVGSVGASIELGEDAHLAPHHATVIFEEQRLLLRDEGTANGVFLKLRLAGALEPGDQFIAGQRLLRFDGPVELPSSEAVPPIQGAPRPAGTPVRIVEILEGGKPGRTCHRAGPVIAVGKTGCDLNFGSDALLAARHAEIHLGDDGTASLLDLGNAESGVLLRVRQGASVELQAGDVLQLGGQVLRIETEQST